MCDDEMPAELIRKTWRTKSADRDRNRAEREREVSQAGGSKKMNAQVK